MRIWGKSTTLSILKDVVVIYGIIILVYSFMFELSTINNVSIHPFWVAIVLVAILHGTYAGIGATLLGIILVQLAGGMPVNLNYSDLFSQYLSQTTTPALWLLSAVVIGEIRNQTLHQLNDLQKKNDLLAMQNETITSYCDDLEQKNRQLENRIASGTQNQALTDLQNILPISKLSYQEFSQNLSIHMERIFGPIKYRLYDVSERQIQCLVESGYSFNEQKATLPPSHVLLMQETLRPLSSLRKQDLELLKGEALFASPVFEYSSGSSKIAGVLSIELLETEKVHPRTADILQIVCHQLSAAFSTRKKSEFDFGEERRLFTKSDQSVGLAKDID